MHKTSEAEFPEQREIKGKEEVIVYDENCSVQTEKEKGSRLEMDVQVKSEALDPTAESEEQLVTISQLRSASMIKVRVTLEDKEISAIVDTAAQVTIVSDKVFEKLNWKGPVLKKVVLQTAGRQLKIDGSIVGPLRLKLGNKTYEERVYVAPIMDDLLLGLDFLSRNDIIINLKSGHLQVQDQLIPFEKNVSRGNPVVSRVTVCQRTTILPKTVKFVNCATEGQISQFLVEPKPSKDALIPRAIYSSSKELRLCVMNLTKRNIVLKKHQDIGEAQEVSTISPVGDVNVTQVQTTENTSKGKTFSDEDIPNHLQDLVDRSKNNLTTEEIEILKKTVMEYQDVFAKDEYDLGEFKEIKHQINTADAKPVKQRMRKTPLGFATEEKAHLDKMLKAKVIEPSKSEWASAPVLIRKRDGSVRWCIDYRELNKLTEKDSFPLPLVEDCIDTLAGNVYFSKLDANSAYWQVHIKKEDKKKTAFITKYGLFQFARMPFGLCNAPATYCRVMNLILHGLNWDIVLAFLDDILVLGDSFETHLSNLRRVLQRFRKYGLHLKPKKCVLFQEEVEFLGRQVSNQGLSLSQENIKAVIDWPLPKTTREVEQFLGLVNYHRLFLKDLAKIAVPLYNITGKNKFKWEEEQEMAFANIKTLITTAPLLGLPNSKDPFILDTDASDYAIGAELIQIQNGEERVISFGSLALSHEQRRYCTTRKELLAVIRFTRQYRHYLLGRSFTVRTDHHSLLWLLNFKEPQGQLARWLEELGQYDMSIKHRQGKKHLNADALSRKPEREKPCTNYRLGFDINDLPCGGCKYCTKAHKNWSEFAEEVDYAVALPNYHEHKTADNLRFVWKIVQGHPEIKGDVGHSELVIISNTNEKQLNVNAALLSESNAITESIPEHLRKDTDFELVLPWLENGTIPDEGSVFISSPGAKYYWIHKEELKLNKGILWRKQPEKNMVMVIPRTLRETVVKGYHDLPSSGHQGVDRTKLKIQQKYFWYGMSGYIKNYVKSCPVCNKNKKPSKHSHAPLTSFQASAPMERVHMDFLGPLPRSTKGNEYILMIVDQFTKWVECIPLPSQTAEETAHAAISEFFSRFGYPFYIHSDQGRNFESQLFSSICTVLGIHKTRTTAYRPSANGQVERFNRTLMDAVRCFVSRNSSWDEHLAQLSGALRASVNRQTGHTPNMLMLGREVNLPADLMFPTDQKPVEQQTIHQYVQRLIDSLEVAHRTARQNLKASQKRMKKDYDLRVLVKTFNVGDAVYILNKATGKGKCKKLCPSWKGPGVVLEKISSVLFRVKMGHSVNILNHDRLKKCEDRELPSWIRKLQKDPAALQEALKAAKGDKETLYRLCRKPDDGRIMIQCEDCFEWFHGACVGITEKTAKKIKKYVCPKCEADQPIIKYPH